MLNKVKNGDFLLCIMVLLVFDKAFSVSKISLTCTPEFCDDYIQRHPCPPLHPACSDPEISLVIPSGTVCNCCEHCFLFQDLGEDCVKGRPGQPIPNFMCKPGTTCKEGKCVKMTVPDSDFYRGYECKEGVCYCAVVENDGIKKIFGTFEETKNTAKEKQCGCSITAYRAKKSIDRFQSTPEAFLPIPRCLDDGQFNPLQCIDNMCGCVNRTTGEWDPTVRKVLIPTLGPGNPKCFDQKIHKTGQYYTNCERERNALMSDTSWADSGEMEVLLSHAVKCTPDGQYAVIIN